MLISEKRGHWRQTAPAGHSSVPSDYAMSKNRRLPTQILNLTVDHRKLIENRLKLRFGQSCIEQVFQAVLFFLEEAELDPICEATKSEQP